MPAYLQKRNKGQQGPRFEYMKTWTTLSRIGMLIMIGALVLSFFVKGRGITIAWISGAVLCGISLLMVVLQRRR